MTTSASTQHKIGERKITVLISGSGTNLQALIDACSRNAIPNTRIIRVLSNRKSAYGLKRAEDAGIPTTYHNLVQYRQQYPSTDPSKKDSDEARGAYDAELARLVLKDGSDLVVCAGFMHILSKTFLAPLAERGLPIVNLHPSLPDQFKGAGAIEWAWEALQSGKATRVGVMIHYVIEAVDMGKEIVVREVDATGVKSEKELEERFHVVEHEAIVEGTRIALENLGT